jgi:hypothetical protein
MLSNFEDRIVLVLALCSQGFAFNVICILAVL